MTTIRFNKKDDFIAALEARRPWAQAWDKRVTDKHKADEKKALDGYRAKLRANLKLSYQELAGRRRGGEVWLHQPDCPRLVEPQLDQTIRAVRYGSQQVYTLNSDRHSTWGNAYWLLTHDETEATTPC